MRFSTSVSAVECVSAACASAVTVLKECFGFELHQFYSLGGKFWPMFFLHKDTNGDEILTVFDLNQRIKGMYVMHTVSG